MVAGGSDVDRMVEVWRGVLGAPSLGADDDFAAVGGDHVRAVDLVASIEAELGLATTVDAVLEHRTPRALAGALIPSTSLEAGALSVVVRRGGGTATPLVLMPPGGGNPIAYERLADAMAPGRPMLAMRTPGTDGLEAPATTIEEIGQRFLADIESLARRGPVHLVGWSTGGLMAFEVATRLREMGVTPGRVAMIDTLFPGLRVRFRDVTRKDRMIDMVKKPDLDVVRDEVLPSMKKRAMRAQRATQWAVRRRSGKPLDPRLIERWQVDVAYAAAHRYQPRDPAIDVLYVAAEASEPDLTTDPWCDYLDAIEVGLVEGSHAGADSIMGPERIGQLAALLDAKLP